MELGLNFLWPTEVFYSKFYDLKFLENFQNFLLSDKDSSSINVHSDEYSLFEENNSLIIEFKTRVESYFYNYFKLTNLNLNLKEYKMKAWTRGISKEKTSKLLYHNHSNAVLSSIFYIFIDENVRGGELVFHDPRSNANRGYISNSFREKFRNKVFHPKTGDVLIFPSFLYHHVENFSSKRIAVSVDLFQRQQFD